MTRTRSLLTVAVSTLCLLAAGLVPATATGAPERAADVATSVSAVATATGPLQVHLDIAPTMADGSAPYGVVSATGPRGEYEYAYAQGAAAGVDLTLLEAGRQTIRVEFSPYSNPVATYLGSATTVETVVQAPPPTPTTMTLTGENVGAGVLELQVEVPELTDRVGVVVFEVDGHAPVEVPMGYFVIPGRVRAPHAKPSAAGVDITGLKEKGSYHATATFVPGGSNYEGVTAETTTRLSLTTSPSGTILRTSSPRAGVVKILVSVLAAHPANASGTVVVTDLTTGKTVVRVRGVTPYPNLTRKTLTGVAPGKHRYRATFVPARGLQGELTGSQAWNTLTVLGE
ncbi:hypothetical protein NPS01_35040 [Nocardioides psychrotolerans]|uniref:Ig-like domain (Group 3) n=1 Tax=Nocardioides psychrotolerans TaxID=1005945 RepID=A0A1I3NCP9_9ACTN|nr:hypothetical protein [Nocardioides psychrotolerans]GEP39841.1 hypothetical protein NPS01_35040 [Nocardioides psychrotolerans]SFJ06877.1 hypothetical protein SAMN05216561_11785 [Nocardioides psychrotolerans]